MEGPVTFVSFCCFFAHICSRPSLLLITDWVPRQTDMPSRYIHREGMIFLWHGEGTIPAGVYNSALVILTPHNTTVAKRFATFRYYCLMCVYARLGLTVTDKAHQRCKVTSNHRMLLCVACRNGDVSAKLCMKSLEEVFPCFMKIFGWSERNGVFRRRNWHHAFMLSDRPFQNGKKECLFLILNK